MLRLTSLTPHKPMQLAPYLAAVVMFAWSARGDVYLGLTNWRQFLVALLLASLVLLPIAVCKLQSLRNSKSKAFLWWCVGFVMLPSLHLVLSQNSLTYAAILPISTHFFVWLWIIEVLMLLVHKFNPSEHRRFQDWLTMDNVILTIVAGLSFFRALVFNSIDDPMHNQPIHVLIDIKRNVNNLDILSGYFLQFFLIYGSVFSLYWLNHHLFVNRVLAKYGVLHYLWVAVSVTVLITPLGSQLLLLLPLNSNAEFTLLPGGNHNPFDVWNLRIAFLILACSLPLILAFKWQQQSALLAKSQQEKLRAELKWLQQQINPHFLFNTLNNIYSLVLTKAEQAPKSLLQFASLLRFVVYRGGLDKVDLTQEIDYLRDYIELQKMRVSHKADIRFDVELSEHQCQHYQIAPLLLVVILENAFKHGVDATDKQTFLSARLSLDESRLTLRCVNSVDTRTTAPSAKIPENIEGGLGLENLRRRLALAYADNHSLSTHLHTNHLDQEQFEAELTLMLDIKLPEPE